MQATAILRGPHVQATYRSLIGHLAATGMRIGEAIGIDDLDAPIIGAFLDHLEGHRKNGVRTRNA